MANAAELAHFKKSSWKSHSGLSHITTASHNGGPEM